MRRLCPGPCCSTERRQARGPNGRRLCRQCAAEVSPPGRTFCSAACVQAFKIVHWPAEMRAAVWRRDHGVCALCGADTEPETRAAELTPGGEYERWCAVRAVRQRLGGRHVWEADHVVPLVEGGANTLENVRTLCCPCHTRQTAALAGRRAKARRDGRPLPLLDRA